MHLETDENYNENKGFCILYNPKVIIVIENNVLLAIIKHVKLVNIFIILFTSL